jgi:hypothetical protein
MQSALVFVMAALGSVGATAGLGTLLLLGAKTSRVVPYLVPLATGTLLAGACLGLLPKALEREEAPVVTAALLVGLLGFFLLEQLDAAMRVDEAHKISEAVSQTVKDQVSGVVEVLVHEGPAGVHRGPPPSGSSSM